MPGGTPHPDAQHMAIQLGWVGLVGVGCAKIGTEWTDVCVCDAGAVMVNSKNPGVGWRGEAMASTSKYS